jgi:hypothetical protein
MIAYLPSGTSGVFDRWTGVPIAQPATPSAVRSGVSDAAYFGIEVENNLLASINSAIASPFYRQTWACTGTIATGNPAYITDAITIDKALAASSGTSKVVGFVRDKTAGGTGCYLAHFWCATGITTTTGAAVFLTDAGGYSGTAGTFKRCLGIGINTTTALLEAGPLDATLYTGSLGGTPANVGGTADSGSGSFGARFDHVHALTFSGNPSSVASGVAASGSSTVAARLDHMHAINFSGAPNYNGTGALDSGALTTPARLDHTHQLDSGLAKEILAAAISGNAESGNYRAVTVALKDVRGNATGSRVLVEAWLSSGSYGWEVTTAPTGFYIASGQTGDTPTANKRVRGVTQSDGTITFFINTDAVVTLYFHVVVQDKIYQATISFA